MKKARTMILESNAVLAGELKEAFDKSELLTVVYVGDNGEEGIRRLNDVKPEMLLVGMFLKCMDGCEVIRAVKQSFPEAKMVVTGVSSDVLMERAMSEGADYYMIKPFTAENALERVEALYKEKENGVSPVREYAAVKRRPVTTEEKISDIFMAIGIPPHIKGYGYLRDGICLTVNDPGIINNVTRRLYPTIAKKHDTTPSKVERAIRHAIEVAWNRGRIDAINAIFGTRIYLGTEKPTNSEFIALVADKLILESMG